MCAIPVLVIAITSAIGCGGCRVDDPGPYGLGEDVLVDEEHAEWFSAREGESTGFLGDAYPGTVTLAQAWSPPTPTFEERYRAFLARDAEQQRCMSASSRGGEDPCRNATDIAVLLRELDVLAREFPDRSSALAPDFVRLRKARVAEIEAEFQREGFQLDVDYGAREERYWECVRRCDRLDDRGAYDRCIANRPRVCGVLPVYAFRCVLDAGDLDEYLEALVALGAEVPPEKIRRARLAFARVLENPSPFHCEGEMESVFERAYEEYGALDDEGAMRRVAMKRAEEMLRNEVCMDFAGWWDSDVVPAVYRNAPPTCTLEALDRAEEWLAKAGKRPDREWREQLVQWSQWAMGHAEENLQLPCAAIALAERAGDVERVRKLTLAYGPAYVAACGRSGE